MALQREENLPVLVEGEVLVRRLSEEINRSGRYGHTFTILILRPPQAAGKHELLSSDWFGSLAGGLVRGCDVVAVFENDPAVVMLLPETGVSGAGALLDRIRSVIPDPDHEWQYSLLEFPAHRKKIESFIDQAA